MFFSLPVAERHRCQAPAPVRGLRRPRGHAQGSSEAEGRGPRGLHGRATAHSPPPYNPPTRAGPRRMRASGARLPATRTSPFVAPPPPQASLLPTGSSLKRVSASRSERAGSAPSMHSFSCISRSSKEAAKGLWASTARRPLQRAHQAAPTELLSLPGDERALAHAGALMKLAASSLHRPPLPGPKREGCNACCCPTPDRRFFFVFWRF